mgnify:CR=1 FL=1
MVIYFENSIEEILKKNLHKGENEPIIGVGVDVITKPFNSDKPFFYKANIKHLYKEDLEAFVSEEDFINGKKLERYIVAVRANVNMVIDEFKEQANEGKLVTVLESDWYTKKLINIDTIQEVQGFVFDSQEIFKEK